MLDRFPQPVDVAVPGGTTNAYLLGDPGVLVDPVTGLDTLGLDPDSIAHVAVTHTHPDHVLGVETISRTTDATVWAFGPCRARFRERTGVEPDRTFRDGTEIGSTGVTILELPGHAPDHVGFQLGEDVLVGDLARADGSVMVGDDDGDMRAYLTSFRRLIQADVGTAYPGHGPPIQDPAGRFRALLAHRLDRERRVARAVADGARTPAEIVEVAYEKDLTGLESAAVETVRAHLEKLAVEGRVCWDGVIATVP